MKRKNDDSPILWLAHSGPAESTRAEELSALGYRVVGGPWSSPVIIRKKVELPCAVVIDLSRSPSTGRDIAVAMRSHRALVNVPFILVEGEPDKIATIKKLLPDAIATTWPRIGATLVKARAASLHRVGSSFRCSRPTKENPGGEARHQAGNHRRIGKFSAEFRRDARHASRWRENPPRKSSRDLTLWFVRTNDELRDRIVAMKPHAASGRLWIIWRKGAETLNQNIIRKAALDSGLVDFRISRIDDEWSGLRFTLRK